MQSRNVQAYNSQNKIRTILSYHRVVYAADADCCQENLTGKVQQHHHEPEKEQINKQNVQ